MIIAVSGTPGTGKTTISKWISKKYKMNYIDVNKVIEEEKLFCSYDKKRDSKVIDIKILNKRLVDIIKGEKECVIDSHLSHFLPKEYVDLCIVCKCELKELKKRLEKRVYSKDKIKENLDSEIFDICFVETKETGHKVYSIDTSKPWEKRVISIIKNVI